MFHQLSFMNSAFQLPQVVKLSYYNVRQQASTIHLTGLSNSNKNSLISKCLFRRILATMQTYICTKQSETHLQHKAYISRIADNKKHHFSRLDYKMQNIFVWNIKYNDNSKKNCEFIHFFCLFPSRRTHILNKAHGSRHLTLKRRQTFRKLDTFEATSLWHSCMTCERQTLSRK